ncbi:MAG: hypothetical protein L0G89_00430 [Janibacter sp.]|nr:hypothetical protein [Janibacter sp.]
MSGSRAKKQRKTEGERLARFANAEIVARSADAVLSVDLSDVEFRSRTDQVVVGLCRAAFAQSKVIAALDTNRLLAYLRDAGHEADFDPTEMDSFELDDETRGAIHQQSTRLNAAVDSSEVKPWSIYSMWLGETQFSHASGNLAGQYAPTLDDFHMSSGAPDPMDSDLEAHRLLQVHIVVMTEYLLSDEGLPEELSGRIGAAFFSV